MNLLFIAPKFYNYEKAIKDVLDTRYEKVIFCNEIPYNMSIYYNALKRISSKISRKISNFYCQYIVKLVAKQKIDIIFIIRGAFLSESCLISIRKKNPNIMIINYQWDSIENNPNGLIISKFSDRNYSFDLGDVLKYKEIFQYVPLFYSWGNVNLRLENKQPKVDIFFLGSYHSRRHEIVKIIKRQCEEQGIIFRSYIYIPRFVYYRKRLVGEKLQRSDVNFNSMSRQDYFHSIENAKIVLDIQSPTQTGATIRSIETLSLGRKLLSTNQMLINEEFYSPKNIFIWDGLQKLDFKHITESSFDHSQDKCILSIDEWLKKIGL